MREAQEDSDRRAAAWEQEDAAITAKIEERRRFLLDLRERAVGGHADLERLKQEAEHAEAELARTVARQERELGEKVQLARDTQARAEAMLKEKAGERDAVVEKFKADVTSEGEENEKLLQEIVKFEKEVEAAGKAGKKKKK